MVDKKNDPFDDEQWDASRTTISDAVDRGGTTILARSSGSSARSSSSSKKSRRRRMSLGSSDLPANTTHDCAGVGSSSSSNAPVGYETAKSMRRRMSLGTTSPDNNDDVCFSPIPAKPWSSSALVGARDGRQQERRPGSTSPRGTRNSSIRPSLVENLPSPTRPSGRATNGLRSTVHGDSSASSLRHPHQQGSDRSLLTGNSVSMKKKTKKFGKALLLKLQSTRGDPAVSPAGTSADDCGEKSSHYSGSSGNTDHEYYDDEASLFSAGSSKSSKLMAESVRSWDPERLSPRSKRPGRKKVVTNRSIRSADDDASVGSGRGSKSREKSRRKSKLVKHSGEIVSSDMPEVKPKRRGRNMYKIQSGPPLDDSSLRGGSNHSKSSTRSGSIGSKKPSRTMAERRSGSVGKKSSKKMEKLSQHSASSRSSSVGKKSSSSKKMERRASIKAMKKMDCMLGQLEKYEDNLENEKTALRKQLDDMALEKEYVESRNRELESQLEELREKAVADAGLLVNAESTKDQSDREIEQLRIESEILKRRLQRHEVSLLRTQQRHVVEGSGGTTSSEDSKEELAKKDGEITRLKAELGLLRDKLRDKTEDYDQQSAELEQAKDELAMLKYNMEHTGSFRYHNMHQLIRERQTTKMQPGEAALSNFFDAY